jgi:hypothetical protein
MTAASTRRAILTGAAGLPALSLPAIAADVSIPSDLVVRFRAVYKLASPVYPGCKIKGEIRGLVKEATGQRQLAGC